MVDREARDRAALLIRRLAAGHITNDEFEDALPLDSDDPAIWAVFEEGAWATYSDLHEHRLVGTHRLNRAERRHLAKCVLFLKSNAEYTWPRLTGLQWLFWLLAAFLTLGLASRVYRHLQSRSPHAGAWPFSSTREFDDALLHPPFMRDAA